MCAIWQVFLSRMSAKNVSADVSKMQQTTIGDLLQRDEMFLFLRTWRRRVPCPSLASWAFHEHGYYLGLPDSLSGAAGTLPARRSRAESRAIQISSSGIPTQPQQNALKRIKIAEIDQHLAAAASAELDLHRRGEQIG